MGTGRAAIAVAALVALGGCGGSAEGVETPGLDAPGTVLTTVKPVRQDVVNKISLTGKVGIDPVFGIVSPHNGEVRYLDKKPTATPVDEDTWVASVWWDGERTEVEIPKGSMLAGRLMPDKARVTEGMPIVSAKHAGYGIVAEIDSAQAYRLNGAAQSIRGQIKNGPGPFDCKPLGTVAALPEGTVPEPKPDPTTPPAGQPGASAPPQAQTGGDQTQPETPAGGSEPTGLRLVCTAPKNIKLINGAEVTLEVITGKAKKALVLPIEAVAGSQGKGKVDLVADGHTRKTVDVVLGLTDGRFIEIKSGLKGGETVAVPGPDLPDAPPAGDPNANPSGPTG
ncbi:efflux RND transporter periplasmic adaptor subunit [Actinoplanes sp. NPDC049265]|uniref:efflux RND transporter periplasmic adaptor subunit n=1 Tax=Actinoplanes sp. NPDC049265 TaxID=3363902 RepID=UPI0037169268